MLQPEMSRTRPSSFSRHRLGLTYAAAVLLAGCEKPPPAADALAPAAPALPVSSNALPVDKVLTDSQGRPLDARIIAKDDREIHVVRKSDRMNFTVPVASLSPADQQFVSKLESRPRPAGFRHGEVFGAGAELPLLADEEPPYLRTRREAIARLKERILLLEAEIEATSNAMIQRSKGSEIERIRAEIAKLELDMQAFRR